MLTCRFQNGLSAGIQLLKDLAQGPDLMEHTRHLAGHDAAGLYVAVKDRPAQAAQGNLLQLLQRGSPLSRSRYCLAILFFSTRDRASDGPAGDGGVAVLGLE